MTKTSGKDLAAMSRLLRTLTLPYPIADLAGVGGVYWEPLRCGQAAFKWRSRVILLAPVETSLLDSLSERYKQQMLYTLVPALAHELRHAKQLSEWGLLRFFLNNLPFVQSIRMEKEAYAVEDAARKQLGLGDGLTL